MPDNTATLRPLLLFAMLLAAGIGRPLRLATSAVAQTSPAEDPATGPATSPATRPAVNAADLYRRAAESINVDSPASSNLEYPGYPPFSEQWEEMAKDAWERNAGAREIVRAARDVDTVTWPKVGEYSYLNQARQIANEIGDASLYQDLQGNGGAAIDQLNDLWHLSALLKPRDRRGSLVELLVSVGIDAVAVNRLMIVTSGITFTRDADSSKTLSVDRARNLVNTLLIHTDARQDVTRLFTREVGAEKLDDPVTRDSLERVTLVVRRGQAERSLAAMSIACHLFRFDNERWPATVEELVPKYLAAIPADPIDGAAQLLNYVLIKAGLPDGSDRPLVFSKARSRDGLFYRADSPQYAFHSSGVSTDRGGRAIEGGQFRDVARWAPLAEPDSLKPTTRPLR